MTNISINKLHEFKDHPYKVLDNDEMNNLIESVQEQGIMSPLIVRPLEGTTDEYEIISGHRRFRAAQKAGLKEIPAFIRPVSRDEATIMLVDSNLHREHILPSEKAFAYKLKMEALAHQGASRQVGEKWSVEQVAESANESARQIHRYIRLTNLIPELLNLMDEGKIAFSVGVELSYLDEELQYALLDIIEQNDCTPSYSQAFRMHKAVRDGLISPKYIEYIMSEEKANQREMLKIPMDKVRAFAPKVNDAQLESFVLKACDYYQRYLKRQRDRER